MPKPTLWLDGDACPKRVREIALKAADRLDLKVILVANQYVRPPAPRVRVVVVERLFDAADDHIVDEANPGDVAITADIPLADRLVKRGVHVLDHRGRPLDEASIGEALAMRNLKEELRSGGLISGGPAAYGDKDAKAFAGAFDRLMGKLRATW